MEKRAYNRIAVSIRVKYCLWNPPIWKHRYSGTIKNISEKGICLSTKTIYFPRDSLIEIYIPFNKSVLIIPLNISNIVWRSLLSDNTCDEIGIELSNPPQDYLEYVNSINNLNQFHIPILTKYIKKWWS